MGCNYKNWVVTIKKCTKKVISFKKYYFWVVTRKWVVLLTNCKWVVVNSIRIQKWVVHSYKSQMGYKFSATHLWAY